MSLASTIEKLEVIFKREEKLQILSETGSVKSFSDWQTIIPNEHHDWVGHRSEAFAEFYPMGSTGTLTRTKNRPIFYLYSNGYKTGRDAYIYNFSSDICAEKALLMTQDYLAAISEIEGNSELTLDEVANRHALNIKWDVDLKKKLKQKKKAEFRDSYIRKASYRPFVATNCYADYIFAQRKGKIDEIFPDSSSAVSQAI